MSNVRMGSAAGDDDEPRLKPRTLSRRELKRQRWDINNPEEIKAALEAERPHSRHECVNAKRPCIFISCKYNLYIDVNPVTGSIKFNFPSVEIWDLKETCALDVAERGGVTLEEIGDLMNLTRERVRQLESDALKKVRGTDLEYPDEPGSN
ncbi:MAG: sigma factor-like helix-turn-helix DNA-binding protein [Myxococcota bacterium]|jgi:hypothetical protein